MARKLRSFCLLFAASLLCVGLEAGSVTDFSGTWVLVPGRSQGPLTQSTWIITQNEKEIAISMDAVTQEGSNVSGSKRGTRTYKLDGSEVAKESKLTSIGISAPELSRQVRMTDRTKWSEDGKVLELIRTMELSDGKMTETDRLELTDNGTALKVKSTSESTSSAIPKHPGGDYIYTKRSS